MRKFLTLSAIATLSFSFTMAQHHREGDFEVYGPFTPTVVYPKLVDENREPTPSLIQREMDDKRDYKAPSAPPVEDVFYPDPVWQQQYSYNRVPTTQIVHNFDGMGFNGVQPPDPTGCVGANHYVQAINTNSGCGYRVYNKTTGAVVGTYSFTGLGGSSYSSYGDPVVVYDELAQRWVFAEIYGDFFSSRINIYVSQTTDPTNASAWYYYQINVDGSDYPKLSMWPSCYLLTCNDGGPSVYALNRANMLAGTATTVIKRTASDLSAFGFQALTPVDFDGPTNPPANAPGILMRHRDTEAHGPAGAGAYDYVEIFQFTPDFVTPANSVWTGPLQIQVSEFSSNLNGYTAFNCFSQPGTGQKLDPLRELLMNRAQYINFGAYQSIVCAQVTDVNGSDLGGVRWYEFRNTGSNWTLHQEGTYSPDNVNRWMPGISQDINGNIAVCYSRSNTSVYPGLGLTGRSASDPLGQMTLTEFSIVNGTSSQTSGERWGDYFCTSLDPGDYKTFWFTGEYMKNGGNWGTRVFAFRFSQDTLDANMFSVRGLTTPACDTTGKQLTAVFRNLGSNTITSLNIVYELNAGSPVVIPWSGSLATNQSDSVIINLSGLSNGSNSIDLYVENPNGSSPDNNTFNDTISGTIMVSLGLTGTSTLTQDITCNNAANGIITLSASGGVSPYTYALTTNYSGTNPITGISGGTYSPKIKDAAGCIFTTTPSITLTNPPVLTLSATKTDCSNGSVNDGTITVTAGGGSGTITYSIDGTNYQSSNVFSGLASGNYTVTIKDANGCTKTINLNIGVLGIDSNPLDGSITIYPNPSTGLFQVSYTSSASLDKVEFSLIDISGRTIQTSLLKNAGKQFTQSFDLTQTSKGVYILRIASGKWQFEERIVID